MYSLLIKNGTIVTHEAVMQADIAVEGEKIAAIGEPGSLGPAEKTIDATGKLVMPGLIDPHAHTKQPCRDGSLSPGDFYDMSKAAAFGGNTMFIDFAIQWDKEKSLPETLAWRREDADPDVCVDYSLHVCPTISAHETVDAVQDVINAGVTSFKLYMTYSNQNRMSNDGVLIKMLEASEKYGSIVGVHAENDAICLYNEAEFKDKGWTHTKYFPLCKGNIVEAEAVNRVLYLNRYVGGKVYIFHLTNKEALDAVAEAQSRGQDVIAETCAHYLTLDDSYLANDDGINYMCSPPLRSKEDVESLWQGIRDGIVTIISSDHCGFSTEQKKLGNGNFMQTPNGLPSIEMRLSSIYTEGVLKNHITLPQMVALLSTNAAKTFGVFPQKGILAPGSDADIIIVETETEKLIKTGDPLYNTSNYTPFEGRKFRGFAETTILRGEIILDKGKFTGERGKGRFVARKP